MSEGIDFASVSRLIALARQNGLRSLELTQDGFHVAFQLGGEAAPEPLAAPAPPSAPTGGDVQCSPVVGTFFSARSPGEPPLAAVGSRVEKGQVIGMIEAMKMFSELTAQRSGVITAVFVENGQTVGVGDPLFEIKGDI